MAFDPATGQLVLFGGNNGTGNLNDTWIWTGSTWRQQSPSVIPPARSGATMAFDSVSGQLLLFGGGGNTASLNDSWVWTGTTWSQLSFSTSPPARGTATMDFDPATGQLVLFGGIGPMFTPLNDTWAYQLTTHTVYLPLVASDAR
jgi:hypothetical protein